MSQKETICCLGAGYVGGPTMCVIAHKCPDIKVIVADPAAEKIRAWQDPDHLPIFEPGLSDLVRQTLNKNLFFTTDMETAIREASIIFVSVGTPTKYCGIGAGSASNLTYLESATRIIARTATTPKIIVEKSTVPVRNAEIMLRILSTNPESGRLFQLVNNPEFLAEGTAVSDLLRPDRVLIGGQTTPAGHAAVERLASVYAHWVPRERIITTNLWSSECSKLVAIASLPEPIPSINAISELCEATGADVDEVARAIGMDSRIGPKFLKTSVGFGGSCFQKDILNLVYLARSLGLPEVADYWEQVITMNEHQKARFSEKIVHAMFNNLSGKKIAVLGFAFKKDTGDTRETPSVSVIHRLMEEGANIAVYDPKVPDSLMWDDLITGPSLNAAKRPIPESRMRELVRHVNSAYEATEGAHAVIICTEWDEFKTLDYARVYASMVKPAFIFDGRNILDYQKLFELGFEVHSLGRRPLSHFPMM